MDDKQVNQFFYLPFIIGEHIHNKIGNGRKGIFVYILIYFSFSTLLSIMTNGIDIWVLEEMIPSIISNYFLVGMLYVFFFIWRR